MKSNRLLALLVAFFTLTFILSPLASDGFNGFTPEQFPVVQESWPVQPVSWAFSVWGLIYLSLLVGATVGLWHHRSNSGWNAMRPPLIISLAVGTFWIAAANNQPLVATGMIVVMSVAAIIAMSRAPSEPAALWPVALYAGWLTAATGVAISVVLSGYAILSAQASALALLAIVLVSALAVLRHRPGTWAYAFGVGWALMGVIVANLAPVNWPVIVIAGAGIAALVLRLIFPGEKAPHR